ncbi:MAG: penicillin-binding transpeptidase domain-containing protein [Bacteroidota bacterium]|nr:penicillin-binding transpeptidase domain-containing protein [Bacteroidota bacterium]
MDPFQGRRWVIILIVILIGMVFIFRLLFVQVIDSKWKNRAKVITLTEKSIQPPRGLIYDRNGKLLVSANQVYDIMVTPKEIGKIDTLALCSLLGISKSQFDDKIIEASSGYNVSYKASLFIEGMYKEDYAKISTALKKYSGFAAVRSSERGYPKKIAAHILGYIRKISKEQYDNHKNDEEPYFKNDYIGITGLESVYENDLRGQRGKEFYLKDYKGNKKEQIEENKPVKGKNLYTSIDSDLQQLGEQLMKNKLGCIVAIEPKTGEILSMVSAPTFDPSLLSGKNFSSNYKALLKNDSLKPLINRPIYNDSYRPGSIFKLVQSLIALNEGVIKLNSYFPCNKQIIGCHNHEPPYNLKIAIQHSCNPYFYQVYKRLILRGQNSNIFIDSRLGLEKWRNAVQKFGIGVKLKTDIPGLKKGLLPSLDFYDSWYGKNRWAFSTIYSNSIGEGELGVSPIQMANLAAIIANKGYYYTPHLVKKIGKNGTKRPEFLKQLSTEIDSVFYNPVIDAMERVVLYGTAKSAQIDSISVCGKTGTVENKNFNDHSVFIAFAPKENPKIALAVYVEFGTWGGTWAAPIASVLIEKFLKGKLSEKGKVKKMKIEKAIILNKNSDFTF